MEHDNELLDRAASRLVALMKASKVTQTELAVRSGITQGQVNHICNNHRYGNVYTWYRIAKALNVTLDYFFE